MGDRQKTNQMKDKPVLQLVLDDLDRLSRLGNEPHLGNSEGNVIAQATHARLKAFMDGVKVEKFSKAINFLTDDGNREAMMDEDLPYWGFEEFVLVVTEAAQYLLSGMRGDG